jgi:xanthine/uracil permease
LEYDARLAMNYTHIHLAINHSPLYATLFAFFFVLIGTIMRNRSIITAGLIIAIIAALCAIAADFTGDQASDIIDHSPPIAGVDKTLIGVHDQAATWAVTSTCICGGVAVIAFFFRRRWLEILLIVLLAWSFAVVARTALLGGRIHHPEVRAVVRG